MARVAYAAAARDSYRSWHHFCMSNHVDFEAEREVREEEFEAKMETLDSHLQELERLNTDDEDKIKKVMENPKARDLLESLRDREAYTNDLLGGLGGGGLQKADETIGVA